MIATLSASKNKHQSADQKEKPKSKEVFPHFLHKLQLPFFPKCSNYYIIYFLKLKEFSRNLL